jgi:RNA polymerase sigma factor (TIGR02999 family)
MSLATLEAGPRECVLERAEDFSGDPGPFVAVYEGLRCAARGLLRKTAWDELSLEPTGLVHEAVLRVLGSPHVRGRADRRYVFAAAVVAMRRILVERARARKRAKRGGGWKRIPLDGVIDHLEGQAVDVVELNDALERLAQWDARQAETFTMHVVLGMTAGEIAQHHGLCEATVRGDLALARAWLRRELKDLSPTRPS